MLLSELVKYVLINDECFLIVNSFEGTAPESNDNEGINNDALVINRLIYSVIS